jgi:hypothetical protein
MMTTITADHVYLAARYLLGPDRVGAPFHLAAESVREQADAVLNASLVLLPETGAEAREQLRIATQDLCDVSALMARRVEMAGIVPKSTNEIVARYATEYHAAIEAWRNAMSTVTGSIGDAA